MSASDMRKMLKWIGIGFGLIIVIGAIAAVVSPPKHASTGATAPATTSTHAVTTHAVTTHAVAVPGVSKDAAAYVQSHSNDVHAVQNAVQIVQLASVQLQKSGTQADLNAFATAAQQAHDQVDGVRNNLADTSLSGGPLDNAEVQVFTAANDLKNAMGAGVAMAGNPNAATGAQFNAAYQTAVGEWNAGITAIWQSAKKADGSTESPPTL